MAMAAIGLGLSSCSSPAAPSRTRCGLRIASTRNLLAVAGANKPSRRGHRPAALPETAAAAALVAGAVGVAASLLRGGKAPAAAGRDDAAADRRRQQQEEEAREEECSECGGTGLCPRCKGEGFVFKELPAETASRARRAAKNMATRYTAGLPTKWTYCNRCSSARSCTTCGGSGRTRTTPTTTTTITTTTTT